MQRMLTAALGHTPRGQIAPHRLDDNDHPGQRPPPRSQPNCVQSSRRSWPVYQTRSWTHGRPASCRQKTPSSQKTPNAIELAFEARLKSLQEAETGPPDPKCSATPTDPALVNGHDGADSSLPFPKTSRRRDKRHLRFVASQPCLVCRRTPSDPHHLRFAEPRALGCKVSDEFAVPLCRTHHRALHDLGDERTWPMRTVRCAGPRSFRVLGECAHIKWSLLRASRRERAPGRNARNPRFRSLVPMIMGRTSPRTAA